MPYYRMPADGLMMSLENAGLVTKPQRMPTLTQVSKFVEDFHNRYPSTTATQITLNEDGSATVFHTGTFIEDIKNLY